MSYVDNDEISVYLDICKIDGRVCLIGGLCTMAGLVRVHRKSFQKQVLAKE